MANVVTDIYIMEHSDKSPCKECITLAVCKTETRLMRLLVKCPLIREYYNYDDRSKFCDVYDEIGEQPPNI